jgi:hypothetical protein
MVLVLVLLFLVRFGLRISNVMGWCLGILLYLDFV